MKLNTELQFDVTLLNKGYGVLRSLNNPLRQKIIKIINKQGKINVTELYLRLHIEQSAVSAHLKILKEDKFVEIEKNGREIFYTLNYERFVEVGKLIKAVV